MKKQQLNIGCSSFNNAQWKRIFYPEDLPSSKWFNFYTQYFKTYELNATFYKTPTVKSLKTWSDKVPVDFIFSVKAPKAITHFKKFVDCKTEVAEFYAVCQEGLNEKLGCVLFQLPPSFDYSPEKLALIIDTLDRSFTNVVEFRNQSWWNDVVYSAFQEKNITFCNVSYPNLPSVLVPTNNIGYVRLHGVPKLFYSDYSNVDLQKLMQEIVRQKQWQKVFVLFNNTASQSGILNALDLKKLAEINQQV